MQDALERTSIENNVPIDRVSCNVWKVQQSIERGTKLHGRGSRPAQPVSDIGITSVLFCENQPTRDKIRLDKDHI